MLAILRDMDMQRRAAANRLDDERPIVADERALEAAVQLRQKRSARHVPGDERRGRKAGGRGLTLERVLVVQRGRGEGIVSDIRHAEHLQRRRGVTGGVVALNAAGIEPCEVDAAATKTLAEMHVLRNELHIPKPDAFQRARDVLRDRFVAFPGAGVGCPIEDAARRGLVAGIDHGDAQLRHQALDLLLKPPDVVAIDVRSARTSAWYRTHAAPSLMLCEEFAGDG